LTRHPKIRQIQTIEQLFADELPASSYGEKWVIFLFDRQTQIYVKSEIDSTLSQGDGFWMMQITDADVTIDLPVDVADGDAVLTNACASTEGCFPAQISTSATASAWSLLGAPYASPVEVNKIQVTSSNGVCATGCDLAQAKSEGLLLTEQWTYDTSSGQYVALADSEYLQPWQGLWFNAAALP